MTDTREQFEAHFKLSARQAKRDNSGEYIDELVRLKWEGWQAALSLGNNLDIEKERRAFEAWFPSQKYDEPLARHAERPDEYEYLVTHVQWLAWQARAAREAQRIRHLKEALTVANDTLAKFPR